MKKIYIIYLKDKSLALKMLIDEYKGFTYRFSFYLCKNSMESDDLFQDTWVKVIKNIDKYTWNERFEPWIRTICLNTYKDKYRKSKRWLNIIKDYFDEEKKEREIINFPSKNNLPEKDTIKNEEKKTLKKAVDNLKDEYRIPIILYYFERLSYKEISEIISIPEGTIKSRLNKARKLLKEYVEVELNG
ncbi:RNA polymerase sigma factor [Clostridium tetani]|uniref:RNA polymerase sigma factor n=1 Tax=Clostridium tetani TaxID=1513 RepID=UPI0038B3EB3B